MIRFFGRGNLGDAYPVTETMVVDGIGTMICSLFGSPFGTVMYFGHPAYKKSGATSGYRCGVTTPETTRSVVSSRLFHPSLVYGPLKPPSLSLAAPGWSWKGKKILLARKSDRG